MIARKPSRLLAGEGYVKLSAQYCDAPAKVLFFSSATTTCTPFIPRDRVAASALRAFPSSINTLANLCCEPGLFKLSSDGQIVVPLPPSNAVVSWIRDWLFIE
jgi:hypothetical protein